MTFDHPTELKPPHDLIWGAIANAKNTTFCPRPLWAVVKSVFGCGSTMATNLCIDYGFDPDKEVPPIECPRCEEDMIYMWGTEDDAVILNKHGAWHETLYASCPEQAKHFLNLYENRKFLTVEEWEELLSDHYLNWEKQE